MGFTSAGLTHALTQASELARVPSNVAPFELATVVSLPRISMLATETHPLIKAKQAEITSSQAGVKGAKSQFYPTPFVRGERYEGKNMVVAGVKQPLWTGGRLTADLSVAESATRVTELSLNETRLEVALKVGAAWLDAMSAKGRLDASLSGRADLHELEAMMERRRSTGYAPAVDASLIQARMTQMENDIDRARIDLAIALHSLSQLTSTNILAENLGFADAYASCRPVEGRIDEVTDGHPAVRRAEAALELAKARVTQARKQVMPTLSARAEYQAGKYTGSTLEGYRLFVGFEQSFGAGSSLSAQVDAANANALAAGEQVDTARRDASNAVQSDFISLLAAVQRVTAFQRNVADLSLVSSSYRRSFEVGRRSWLELLNIVRERSDAIQQVSRAKAEVIVLNYRLCMYQGGDSR